MFNLGKQANRTTVRKALLPTARGVSYVIIQLVSSLSYEYKKWPLIFFSSLAGLL